MPTPFTHMLVAQRLLSDSAIPAPQRALLKAHTGAYLLGSVVADAHGLAGLRREDTHFYAFDKPMEDHAWRVMMARYPALAAVRDPAWCAFLAGYVMHVSMDEIWSLDMTGPEFADREWAPRVQRFLMLHILLIYMDERDLPLLNRRFNRSLHDVPVHHWLPFLDDAIVHQWGEYIYHQVMPGGVSETLEVYGSRLQQSPGDLRAILDSPERMHDELWTHVTPEKTAEVEMLMLDHARTQMVAYLSEIR